MTYVAISPVFKTLQNYWKAFVAAIAAATFSQLTAWLRKPQNVALEPFMKIVVDREDTSFLEYVISFIVAVAIGAIGAYFVKVRSFCTCCGLLDDWT